MAGKHEFWCPLCHAVVEEYGPEPRKRHLYNYHGLKTSWYRHDDGWTVLACPCGEPMRPEDWAASFSQIAALEEHLEQTAFDDIHTLQMILNSGGA